MSMFAKSLRCCMGLVLSATALAFVGCARTAGPRVPPQQQALQLYVQGVQHHRAGETQAAIDALERAIAANPDLRMARSLLGDLYRARGDYLQASMQYEIITRNDPYTADNHYRLGVTYQFLDRLQSAAGSYLRALNLDPKDSRSAMNLGTVYLAMGDFDQAVVYLEKSTQLAPESAQAWGNLGVALDARGSAVLAEAAYRKSLELEGMSNVTLQNLGSNLIAQNKGAEAVAIWEEVLKTNDTPATRKRYADALAAARRNDEALREYDAVLNANPRYLPAINGKAAFYIRLYRDGLEIDDAKRTAALELWRTSLRLNPNQPDVRAALTRWENPPLFSN